MTAKDYPAPSSWICDECGERIAQASDGFLEWLHDDAKKINHGFRIVHHAPKSPRRPKGGDCYKYTKSPGRLDDHLTSFVGPRGMVNLLLKLDIGPIHEPVFKGPKSDVREWKELFMRLHVPLFEEARQYLPQAEADGFFDGSNEFAVQVPETFEAIIKEYKS